MKFRVTLHRIDSFTIDVEAEDEAGAVEAAYEEAPYLCAQCSGWGMKNGGVDAGEWYEPDKEKDDIETVVPV